VKLLQVNSHYAPVGGAEQYLSEVSAHLERCGVQVAVLYGVKNSDDFHVPGRREECLNELLIQNATDRFDVIRRVVEVIDPDLIQVHNLDHPEVIELFANLRPTVQFVHAHSVKFCPGEGKFYKRTQEICRRPFGPYCLIAPYIHQCGSRRPWRILSNYLTVRRWLDVVPRLKKLIVASRYMKEELLSVGVEDRQIVINPIGIEIEEETSTDPAPVESEPMVLFVGRMYEHKGPQDLLAALKLIKVPCRAVFVGDGAELERLKQAAHYLLPQHRVQFTGWLDPKEIKSLYQQAAVVVVPSLWPEPFGMVGIEALNHGKPVVAFNVGGVSEWLKHGENGFLVPPKDISRLAAAIETILTNPGLAHRMGQRARALAVEQFDIDRHVGQLLEVYQEALSGGWGNDR
jgi:glycosyltransferase involved in cell wall biosynthesis